MRRQPNTQFGDSATKEPPVKDARCAVTHLAQLCPIGLRIRWEEDGAVTQTLRNLELGSDAINSSTA